MQIWNDILSLLGQHGYLAVFLGVTLESAGVPIPGETVLLASGLLAHRGTLDLGSIVAFGVLGAVLGDQIGYWVGRKGGRPVVLRWGRYALVTPERLACAELFFARHGGKAVFLARFVAGLRVFGALVAGVGDMRWRTFFLYNALGGIVWVTMSVLVGYLLWESIGLVEPWLGRASILLLAPFALVLLLYRSYRLLASPNPSGRAVERSNGRREMTTRSTKSAVKATVALALVSILVAMLVGGYVGERPWVWDPAELVSWLLKLL